MSEQILLQGKILGIEEFLMARAGVTSRSSAEELLAGRSQWITLLSEILPRALLTELGLARVLLGSSGGGQFLLVLPGEVRPAAETFLQAAAAQARELSIGFVKLIWGFTENLGDWTVVRRRLNDELQSKRSTPLAGASPDVFAPHVPTRAPELDPYFEQLGAKLREAQSLGWSPESPARIMPGEGKYTWQLTRNLSLDGVTLARHAALADDNTTLAPLPALARRAQGRSIWGVLRGDVDDFGVRLRRLTSIEEHVQLSMLYKQFFAGELETQSSLPDFWRKITVLYSGGDDFAVYGAWDALIQFAREMQRLYQRFTEESLQDFPGAEGKTISMAIALAPEMHTPLPAVYQQAGRNLELAKAADKDCIYILGRILEWKQLSGAADLKETVARLMSDFRASRPFLNELRGYYYKEAAGAGLLDRDTATQRARRLERRFGRILSGTRNREFEKLRTHLITEMLGRKTADKKLRPAGLVALEWAKLATEA